MSAKLTKNGLWESIFFDQAPICPQFRENWESLYLSGYQYIIKTISFLILQNWPFLLLRKVLWCCHHAYLTRWNRRDEEMKKPWWQYQKAFLTDRRFLFVIFISISLSILKVQDDRTLSIILVNKQHLALKCQKSMYNEEIVRIRLSSSLINNQLNYIFSSSCQNNDYKICFIPNNLLTLGCQRRAYALRQPFEQSLIIYNNLNCELWAI